MNIKKFFIVLSLVFLAGCASTDTDKNDTIAINTEAPEETSPQAISAKEWSTYTNDEYGFTINYPRTLDGDEMTIIQQESKFLITKASEPDWWAGIPITVQLNVQDKGDIERFVQQKYFAGCAIMGIAEKPLFADLYPIEIMTSDGDGDCWINWMAYILYSPMKKSIVTMDLGQEYPLVENINGEFVSYAKETAESFRFTD